MKRALVGSGLALILCAVAAPVSASAPVDQYDKFAFETPTIVDLKTGLTWDRHKKGTYPAATDFETAKQKCKGDNGKRLPTLKELLTIVDESPCYAYVNDHNETRYIDPNAFPDSPSLPFWTSSVTPNGDVYTVNFKDGFVREDIKTFTLAYRCVK